ncbi:YjbH domain-containing protein [Geomonas sp. RF6]|uniref:YjbH domain-containing protein n=1 Tax=Geomonas sp. RF6 TaxID=2897342 RepID=UPI001E4D107C|nr:YjbH domain-containing protein [Geomonas sp. RF6]UFS70067.1 YjbH domain-containing protein [Geomonas sp. RF6]
MISRCHHNLVALLSGVAFLLFLIPAFAGAEPFSNTLSMQGYSGLLNIPDAGVVQEGHMVLSYSNQKNVEWPKQVPYGDNYFFNVGFFSIVELGGRLTEAPGLMRDLSANVKVKVPFIPKGYYLPDVAFGLADVGGGASWLQTKYAVATETLGPLRATIGYGTGPDRMKGVFGGAEVTLCDWVHLLAEHDTRDTNAGVKISTPGLFRRDIKLQFTAKSALNRNPGNIDLAFSLDFPLSLKEKAREGTKRRFEARHPVARATGEEGGDQQASEAAPADESSLSELQKRLTATGLQDVRVGIIDRHRAVIVYENNVFNHNELDALGVVFGSAAEILGNGIDHVSAVIERKGIKVMTVSAPLSDLQDFFYGDERKLKESLATGTEADLAQARFVDGKTISSYFKPTVVLWPGLTTFVGTEVGLFDYLLSLKADLFVTPWKGAIVNVRGDIPLSWSENLEDGKLYRRARHDPRLERAMLFQAVKLTPSLYAQAGVGKIYGDINGTLNEMMWTSPEGKHRFRLKQAYGENSETNAKSEVYLGSYRYYFSPLNVFLEGTAGRFWEQDTGGTAELKRFFGDTAFSAYYKNAKTQEGKRWQVGGVQISFPLTPRKDMKPLYAQLRGTEEWSYSQETVISTGGPNSVLHQSIGINPEASVNLQNVYFNRDRLNRSYLLENLQRMSEAYEKYRPKE